METKRRGMNSEVVWRRGGGSRWAERLGVSGWCIKGIDGGGGREKVRRVGGCGQNTGVSIRK
jgi:hypothetical protein